jgi:glutamate--cysteine ligase
LNAVVAGRSLHALCRDLLEIARKGLQARARLNEDGNDEAHFLSPLEEMVARGETAAEEMLKLYHGRWEGSVEPVFREYAY